LKINFLRAVGTASLTADARVVKAGGTLGYVECDLKDATGRLVARAASTCVRLKRERKSGASTVAPTSQLGAVENP
jgi:acyl-coenzyme A thioesterase PaaI-like protein